MATKKTATTKKTAATKKAAAAKIPARPLPDLVTFIENVNKKDRINGKKVDFNFVKRKRKPN
jgi:hypothetical protein